MRETYYIAVRTDNPKQLAQDLRAANIQHTPFRLLLSTRKYRWYTFKIDEVDRPLITFLMLKGDMVIRSKSDRFASESEYLKSFPGLFDRE